MKIKSSSLKFFLFLILLYAIAFTSINLTFKTTNQECNNNNQINILSTDSKNPFSLSYTPHEPIDITSDTGFSSYGFPGSGTEIDPYLIQGYNITTTFSEHPRYAISITDTIKHFVIRDCYLNTSSTYWGWGGDAIRIIDTAFGTVSILNNLITGCSDCIYLSGCPNSIISNNFFFENSFGIQLTSCPLSTVNNNTFTSNGKGMEINKCSGTSVFDNKFISNSGTAIQLYGDMEECSVYDNLIEENRGYAVTVQIQSSKNMFYRNLFIDNNNGGTSQARDDGKRNKWYNPETEEGNYWSDLGEECKYLMDGYSKSKDLYPLNRAETCPNPKAGTTLAIVLPILASVGILAFIIPKYIIPYHREKNIWKSFKRFIYQNRKAIYVLLGCLFTAGAFVLFRGWFLYAWTGDIGPSLISGAVICSSIVVIVIVLGIFRSLNPKEKVEIKHEELK